METDKKNIFRNINDLEQWKMWSQWSPENDEKIIMSFDGNTKGKGATMKWKGRKMGSGKMEIKESNPYSFLHAEIVFINSGFTLQSKFQINEDNNLCHVVWAMEGKIKRFGIAKFIGLLLPRWLGKDMDTALKILKMISEEGQK